MGGTPMDLRQIARDCAQTLANYLTYQSVRVVLEQLAETDPPTGLWLREFSAHTSFQQEGEEYLQRLMAERQELAFRIMTVRDHLAENIPEFLPDMVRSQVQQANLAQRKTLFERMTQTPVVLDISHPDYEPGVPLEMPLGLPLDLRSRREDSPDRAQDSAA